MPLWTMTTTTNHPLQVHESPIIHPKLSPDASHFCFASLVHPSPIIHTQSHSPNHPVTLQGCLLVLNQRYCTLSQALETDDDLGLNKFVGWSMTYGFALGLHSLYRLRKDMISPVHSKHEEDIEAGMWSTGNSSVASGPPSGPCWPFPAW
ncbi:hypothetical protein IAQ61_008633 [Plenodomus lingam]|uniref:uncharacterized protein n=1 Tax=Leptosphaeria maculans TaxID=5022 RepID=UPI00331DA6BB|nr:hypothetical protein IAQ61_008633 [Plenodomus lingam]